MAIKPAVVKPPRYKVGQLVTIPFGRGRQQAEVIEDRGCLGSGGRRRLYRVRMPMAYTEPFDVELSEEELSPVPDDAVAPSV
jgi:hypothetical protein